MKGCFTSALTAISLLTIAQSGSAQITQRIDRSAVTRQIPRAQSLSPLPADKMIDLIIGLPIRNESDLAATLRNIYDPSSPRYRHFLTPSEYNERYAPSVEDFRNLVEFSKSNGLTIVNTPANRKFVHVRASAQIINKVFHTTLRQYQHPTESRTYYAPDVPPTIRLKTTIAEVTGLDDYFRPGRFPDPGPSSAGGSGSGGLYTGKDFRAAYVPGSTLTGKGQSVGILELNGYNSSDIQTYESSSGFPSVPLKNVYLDGYAGGSPNSESAADIELVISMAPGISQATIYGVPYSNAGVHDALNEMANPSNGEPLPAQISTSYYFFYDKNVYAALRQLAAQGQALFVASGDFGSYNETTGSGAFPPADHPYVTSVGSTTLTTTGSGGSWVSETAASFSGGGYSPWASGDPEFKIPSWQQGVNVTSSGGSSVARNSPDVSIVGTNISIYFSGNWSGFAGTSASAPLWAGLMALANERALASGHPKIGFASPALWAIGKSSAYPTCFHDITVGNNFNATNPGKYTATSGYDLVTGWGTPIGIPLIEALVAGTPAPPPPLSCSQLRREISFLLLKIQRETDKPPPCPTRIVAICSQQLRNDEALLAKLRAEYAKHCVGH
jgi:subtilase family serine protease